MRTIRWSVVQAEEVAPESSGRGGMTGTSPVGFDGYCEFLEVGPEAEVLATFQSDQAILEGRPAATQQTGARSGGQTRLLARSRAVRWG